MKHDTAAIIANLTLVEKAALVSGDGFWSTAALPTHRVPAAILADGPHGVRQQGDDVDHLGINGSLPATDFPTASATACSWDRSLLGEIGRALGREARALGVDVLLGPGINIKRSPLCGRNFEYFSEDPLLSGMLGASWVAGLQENGIGASVKHFAVNNQETDRMRVSAEVDERTLREIYLRAFEHVVREARPVSVMASYNAINGIKAAENGWLLGDVLRREWGYEGVVLSDWGAVSDPVASLSAGLDLEMPGTSGISAEKIVAAVKAGELDGANLDRSAARVLSMVASVTTDSSRPRLDAEFGHELAYRAAVQSAVLLENTGALPLDPTSGGSIAVIGEFARTPRYQGSGSSHVVPTQLDDALAAILGIVGATRSVRFEQGFVLAGAADKALHQAAVEAAREAHDVIVFLGLPSEEESEGVDREHLDLPAGQIALLRELVDVNDRVVVVLSNGSVVAVSPWSGGVAAILEMWLGGQASGSAAAALLFGIENPSGKLAETIPHRLEDTPAYTNFPGEAHRVYYGERGYVGYRYYDKRDIDVAYPFGHGLSYTAFEYGSLEVQLDGNELAVSLVVRNAGERAGREIVQFYAEPPAGGDRPPRVLVGFGLIELEAATEGVVASCIPLTELETFSVTESRWVLVGGEYHLVAAASSRDLRLAASVVIDGTEAPSRLSEDSSMREWLESPRGSAALIAMLDEFGAAAAMQFDEDTAPLVHPIPLGTMLGMMLSGQGFRVSAERIARLLYEVNR